MSRLVIHPVADPQIWCSKMQPLSGNQRPDLLTSLMNMSLALRLPREMHLCRSSANVPRLPSFLELLQNPHVLLTFGKVQNPVHLPRKITSEPSKVVRACGLFNLLTWKCASRHNGVHFFDCATSKSAPTLRCFEHFDFHMCLAPQRRALFRQLNVQKWSENGVFCTTACTFSTSQLPKVVRRWFVLYILTWTCALRHNSLQLFISHLITWLRTRRFSEPTFRLRSHKSLEKHSVSRLSYLFAHLLLLSSHSYSSLIFSSLFGSSPLWLFPPLLFHLSILSEVWLPNFLRYPSIMLIMLMFCSGYILAIIQSFFLASLAPMVGLGQFPVG